MNTRYCAGCDTQLLRPTQHETGLCSDCQDGATIAEQKDEINSLKQQQKELWDTLKHWSKADTERDQSRLEVARKMRDMLLSKQ